MSKSQPPSPTTSGSRGRSPTDGLSNEERAERELRLMMSSSPLALSNSHQDDDVDELSLNQGPTASTLTSAATLRNELIVARRKSTQLKLHPYQRDAVEEFVKVEHHSTCRFILTICFQGSSMFREMTIFTHICALENSISTIKSAAPPFVSSPQLMVSLVF